MVNPPIGIMTNLGLTIGVLLLHNKNMFRYSLRIIIR